MRSGKIDRLRRQNMNGLRVLCRQRVVGQMQMEVERGHSIQQTQFVEILVDGQGCDLVASLYDGRPEPELIKYGHFESFHQRSRVLTEALLARHEFVAVMLILHLALLHVTGEAHVMVRREEQARAFPVEPLPDRVDFSRLGLLLGHEVIQTEHHQRVRVCENAFVDREFVPRLVNALVNGDRLAGNLAHDLLKIEGRAVEQLERAGDALQEIHLIPLRSLEARPGDPADFGHRRKAIIQLGQIAVGFPGITPRPVDAEPTFVRRVRSRHVVLVVRSPNSIGLAHCHYHSFCLIGF